MKSNRRPSQYQNVRHELSTTVLSVALAVGLLCGATAAFADAAPPAPPTGSPSPPPTGSGGLSMFGITLYGIVDVGLQYETHGVPFNDYFPAGSADIVQKNGNRAITGVTPSNLSQSRVGLQGTQLVVGDISGVFKLETFFNPQSGDISDALKSLAQNNGRSLATQTTNLDSSVAGQAFQQAFAGFSSPTYGTLTFGRQNSVLADGIAKYDPNAASQAFSLIGLSGTTAGGGDTQDRRLDSSLKYAASFQGFHVGANYKFSNASTGANSAYEFQLGAELAGFSVDAYYVKVRDAVAAAPLTAAQVTTLPTLGYALDKSLAATVSDNTAYSLMALYTLGPAKLFAGYEHIRYANPETPLAPGFDMIGGYTLAFPNNTAFNENKNFQVLWAGVKYTVAPGLDLTAAYYGYRQSSFATGANAGCSSVVSGACSGTLNGFSLDVVARLSKRFDAYAGAMWTGVQDGLANGYLNKSNLDPTIGIRFTF